MAVHYGAHLGFQFRNAVLAAAGNRLITGGDDGFQPETLMQREEGHQRNDGGAVRVGDNIAGVVEGRFRIDFRHHQGHVRLLPEGGGIVNDHTARSRRDRSEFQGNASACAEQGDIHPIKGFFRQFFYSQHFPTESDLFSGGPGGGQKLQGTYGKIACFQAGQDFNAHRSGGADDGNMGCLVHDCCQKMTDIFRPPPLYGSPVIWQYDCKPSGLKMKNCPRFYTPDSC